MLTRRQFLMASAGAGGAFFGSALLKANRTFADAPQITKFTEPLPTPFAGPPPSTLTIAKSSYSFHSNLGEGPTLGYGGAPILGPTIEVTRGKPISINVVNNIVGNHPLQRAIDTELHGVVESDLTNPRVALHLHGSNTEPQSDGYPTDTFTPGQSYVYNFNNNQEAATLWYHDHSLGMTGLNVLAGLAGFYLLRDTDDPAGGNGPLGLPAGAPYEVPLVLQDRSFNSDGSVFHPNQPPWIPEYVADVATVNGKAWPNLNVDRTLYRFRIINGSSARTYNLKLSSKQPIIQIGTDQGLLNAPVYLSSLLLAPGERADVLVDFSSSLPGDKIVLENDANSPYPSGRVNSLPGLENKPLPEMMMFTVNAGAAASKPVPKILRLHKPLIAPIAVEPIRQRFLTLVELDPVPNEAPVVLLLNYVYWDEALKNLDLMERPKVDTVEQWNIINLQPVAHPMHLHLVPFQILNRQKINGPQYLKAYLAKGPRQVIIDHAVGGPTVPAAYPPPDPTPFAIGPAIAPAPNEAGWKDTVLVNPYEVVRLIVPFGAQAAPNLPFSNSFTGTYVWHCHMLGHEDNEMMLPFEVVS